MSENLESTCKQDDVSTDKSSIESFNKVNGESNSKISIRDNIDELDIESIQITKEQEEEKERPSSVVIHDVIDTVESHSELKTQSLDDLECDPVAMIDLDDSEENAILATSDTDKMNSIRTDTTFDDDTPKASTFHMMVFPFLLANVEEFPTHNN